MTVPDVNLSLRGNLPLTFKNPMVGRRSRARQCRQLAG
jgi:hypothetical protein